MSSGRAKVDEQLAVLLRGVEGVYTVDELRERIAGGKRLRVKLGMDPTAPDLTLGHTVVLRKLRQFQDFGHKAVLIIGDYTARVGDPSGRSKTRPMLTDEEIETNATTYLQQAGKVLDLSAEKLEVRHNSEWLKGMSCADVLRLMCQMTVARMLERDTFAKRQAEGKEIFLHELLYPLMQGRDSVAIESDVELGGTDQTFNNLCGRDLQRNAGQPPQIVMTLPLLIGTDGKQKMSKSLGNYVGVTDPPSEMFGKIMRIPDELMRNYFELLTDTSESEIAEWIDPARHNPRDAKEFLAKTIITQYHPDIHGNSEDAGARDVKRVEGSIGGFISGSAKPSAVDGSIDLVISGAAKAAAEEFWRVHGGGMSGLPDEIPEVVVPANMVKDGMIVPIDLIVECLGEKSRGEARRLVAERGVRLNGAVIEDANAPIRVKSGDILQRGKRKFVRLRLS